MTKKVLPSPLTPLSGDAIREQRTLLGLSVAELASRAQINKNTITNIELGKSRQMQLELAKRVARVLKVTLAEISSAELSEAAYPAYAAMGVVEAEVQAGDEVPFQSYTFARDNQPLAYSWHDLRSEKLHLSLQPDPPSSEWRLKVELGGGHSTMASNAALHPENHTPRALTPQQNALAFAARVIDNPHQTPLSIGVRLFDRRGREWCLGSSRSYQATPQLKLTALDPQGGWTPCVIRLTSLATADQFWYLFRASRADQFARIRPDWGAIARVVLEFGILSPSGHPSAPGGKLLVSPIWVGDHRTIASRLPSNPPSPRPAAKGKSRRSK